jgi:hypothetical protein
MTGTLSWVCTWLALRKHLLDLVEDRDSTKIKMVHSVSMTIPKRNLTFCEILKSFTTRKS